MERHLKTVRGSVEFRDAVMAADREGVRVYARKRGTGAPTFSILARHADPFEQITVHDLFSMPWPPVYMEDFAQALVKAGADAPEIDLFVLEIPGRDEPRPVGNSVRVR